MKELTRKTIIVLSIFLVLCFGACSSSIGNKVDEFLSTGDYKSAYDSASDEQKKEILEENIVAWVISSFVDASESILVRDAWFTEEEKPGIVVYFRYKYNGNMETAYFLYKYMGDKYTYDILPNLEESGESKTIMERIVSGDSAKNAAKEIINNSHKMSQKCIDNINSLIEKDKLYGVELLAETRSTYT